MIPCQDIFQDDLYDQPDQYVLFLLLPVHISTLGLSSLRPVSYWCRASHSSGRLHPLAPAQKKSFSETAFPPCVACRLDGPIGCCCSTRCRRSPLQLWIGSCCGRLVGAYCNYFRSQQGYFGCCCFVFGFRRGLWKIEKKCQLMNCKNLVVWKITELVVYKWSIKLTALIFISPFASAFNPVTWVLLKNMRGDFRWSKKNKGSLKGFCIALN